MARKKVFLVVANIKTRNVERIVEGPYESKKQDKVTDELLFVRVKELYRHYPFSEFDIITARSESFEMLKKNFPEFHGWEGAMRENLFL